MTLHSTMTYSFYHIPTHTQVHVLLGCDYFGPPDTSVEGTQLSSSIFKAAMAVALIRYIK